MIQNSLKQLQRDNFQKTRAEVMPQVEEEILNKVIRAIHKLLNINKITGYLGIYWPLNSEVDLRSMKEHFQLPIALPASSKEGDITYHHWSSSSLRKDFHGIPSPLDQPKLEAKDIGLLLVPALAVDQNGYRLGYGGGFFDRLRAQKSWRKVPALVVLPKACVSSVSLPKDSWDIPFNGWINEEGKFRSGFKSSV